MTDFNASLDADVRRAEPDLWLSSRLVSRPETRGALIALYAVHIELAKVAGAVGNALAGEIRLAWWREEVGALSSSRALGHPALNALKSAPRLDLIALDGMIEGRHAELEPRPFNDEAALLAYIDQVDGGLMRAAASLVSPGASPGEEAAHAWGWTRLLRERSTWRAKVREWAPLSWGETSEDEIGAHVRHRVADALKSAGCEVVALPVAAFPAIAYATLASAYALGRNPSELEKRMRLIWASLRGRI